MMSLIYGQEHGYFEGRLTGQPCPFTKTTAATFLPGTMASLAINFDQVYSIRSEHQIQPENGAYPIEAMLLLYQESHLAWLDGCTQDPQLHQTVNDNSPPPPNKKKNPTQHLLVVCGLAIREEASILIQFGFSMSEGPAM